MKNQLEHTFLSVALFWDVLPAELAKTVVDTFIFWILSYKLLNNLPLVKGLKASMFLPILVCLVFESLTKLGQHVPQDVNW